MINTAKTSSHSAYKISLYLNAVKATQVIKTLHKDNLFLNWNMQLNYSKISSWVALELFIIMVHTKPTHIYDLFKKIIMICYRNFHSATRAHVNYKPYGCGVGTT